MSGKRILVDFHYLYYTSTEEDRDKLNTLVDTQCSRVTLWMNYDWLTKTFGADGQRTVVKWLEDRGVIYDNYMINAQSNMIDDTLAVFNEDYYMVESSADIDGIPCLLKSFDLSFSYKNFF